MVESPTSPERVMVVVAHADDAEFTVAGTVAKWAREGKEVTYLIITDCSRGTDDPNFFPAELSKVRKEEQRAAADRLGVKQIVYLDYQDGTVQHTLDLRRDIVRQIRKHRPHIVITMDPTRRWLGQGYINHPDHVATGDATLAAIFPAARDYWNFHELIGEGLMPHKVAEVYMFAPEDADVWIDIGDTIEDKIAALKEHRSQVGDSDVGEGMRNWARSTANGKDMEYAEAFKYFKLG